MISIIRAHEELQTNEARRRWLIDFVNRKDLLSLSTDQVEDLFTYLGAFSRASYWIVIQNESAPALYEKTAHALYEKTAPALYEIQQAASSGMRLAIVMDDGRNFTNVGWRLETADLVRHTVRGRDIRYGGPLRTVFLAAVADVIAADREKKIEICAKPTCERIFLKSGRSKYCSRSCADADRQKRYRTKPESKPESTESHSGKE